MFKDFAKEAKDLLTKNTAEGKAEKDQTTAYPAPIWKIESKLKPKAGSNPVVVNPVGDAKSVSVNVEFVCPQVDGLKTKLAIPSDIKKTKPTVTFEQSGRKVEVAIKTFQQYADYEFVVEDKQKQYAAAVKATPGKVEAELAAPVANGVSVGFGAELATSPFGLSKYSAGVKYNCCKNTNFSLISTGAAASLAITAAFDIPQVQLEGKPINGAAIVSFDRIKNKLGWTFGLAGQVPACPLGGSSFKVKIDNSFSVSISHFVELLGWKIATTYDVNQGAAGVIFTRE
jgi:hypothetical protein